MLTTFLNRTDVLRHTQALTLLQDIRHAFEHHPISDAADSTTSNGVSEIRVSNGTQHPALAVTVRHQLPKGETRATLELFEVPTRKLLAVMDASSLMTLQSSLLGALSVDILSKQTAAKVAIVGDGLAASGALKALRLIRTINRVWLFGSNLADSTEQAFKLQKSLSASVRSTETLDDALLAADIIFVTGENVDLSRAKLRPGTHVSILGDAPKLPTSIDAKFFSDLSNKGTWLGDVAAGRQPGRVSDDDVTVFSSHGATFLDVVTAWHVYFGARNDETLTRLDLEA